MSSLAPSARTRSEVMLAVVQQVLRLVPAAGKYLAILVVLINAGSWPLVWHIRVMAVAFKFQLRERLMRLRYLFAGKARRAAALEAWYESQMPVGVHPFRQLWTYSSWASPDHCDFMFHLSNSSYAMALDAARFRVAIATFPNFLRCGGWAPLAATHYHFIREIPMFSSFEVRVSVGAWDDKWIWIVCRFVKPPSKSRSKSKSKKITPASESAPTPLTNGATTPLTNGEPTAVAQALLARAAQTPEADGAILYTVAVSHLCYKLGRRTVPPAVVLAANGFYAPPAPPAPPSDTSSDLDSSKQTAADAPPSHEPTLAPYWARTAALRASLPALTKFYAGGWREDRWWEEAFASCEAERQGRLVPFVGTEQARSGISGGIEGVRALRSGGALKRV
ncbi:hypothetical protein DFH09DRAFT_973431 [Mycena vulgaris]|nr:hypothetical protein DFH09DRAFT_973431 [Mycena vulgaris]